MTAALWENNHSRLPGQDHPVLVQSSGSATGLGCRRPTVEPIDEAFEERFERLLLVDQDRLGSWHALLAWPASVASSNCIW